MKLSLKHTLLGPLVALLFGGLPFGQAVADWTAKDSAGGTITFNALTTPGGKVLPKHSLTDSTGAFSASVSSSGALKVDAGGTTIGTTQSGGWSVGISGPLPAGANTIGAVTQGNAPWALNLSQVNGSPVSAANPVPITSADTTAPTYSAANLWTLTSGTPTDAAQLAGSATKIIKIRRITINATSTTATNVNIDIVRRSSANSGGAPTTVLAARYDTTDPAPTAVLTTYTGSPSQGTTVATLKNMTFVASTGNGLIPSQVYEFGGAGAKPIVLRGAGEFIAFAANNAANGVSMRMTVEWTEE